MELRVHEDLVDGIHSKRIYTEALLVIGQHTVGFGGASGGVGQRTREIDRPFGTGYPVDLADSCRLIRQGRYQV
jgi:hypothetical protein